jgi:hypothetical protein
MAPNIRHTRPAHRNLFSEEPRARRSLQTGHRSDLDEASGRKHPETRTAYLIVRDDVYRRMHALTAIDRSEPSLYEFGEFHPDR